jgi:ubiquinone/menaquinone biosynthesis C-methylase UbiE
MDETTKNGIINCYDLTARKYADAFLDEMEKKPFDANLLQRFAKMLPNDARVVDFAMGCGHTTAYLKNCGIEHISGMDLSVKAVELAGINFPDVEFLVADMVKTGLPESSLDGILCFYGIVHFSIPDLELAFKEWRRLLKKDGKGIFSFHVGTGELAVEGFLDTPGANAVWKYFMPDEIHELLRNAGLEIEETVVRYPYKEIEYESQRCYIIFSKA